MSATAPQGRCVNPSLNPRLRQGRRRIRRDRLRLHRSTFPRRRL